MSKTAARKLREITLDGQIAARLISQLLEGELSADLTDQVLALQHHVTRLNADIAELEQHSSEREVRQLAEIAPQLGVDMLAKSGAPLTIRRAVSEATC